MSFSDWKEVTLGDYINVKHGYAFKGEFFSEIETENVLVTPGNFQIGGGFKEDKLKYYNGEYPNEYVLKPNDVIVTMTDLSKAGDTLGYSALVPYKEKRRYLHNQRIGLVEFLSEEIFPLFLYWRLRNKDYQNYIVGSASGTTVKHTSPKTIKSFTLNLPPLREQKVIAATLSCIDNKIEVNNKIKEKLENMALEIFKHWFIDFEFSNENGNPYKSSDGKMVESELGDIPEGWGICNLEDIAEVVMGQSPKSDTYNNDNIGLPLINGASDFKKGNINPLKYTSNPKKKSQRGDYVFGVRATVGNVTYVDKEYALGRGVGIARSKMKSLNEFLYFVLVKGINYLESTATGSVYINLSKDDFRFMKVISPPDRLINDFHRITINIFEEINLKHQENLYLQELRDTLLPKLLSGEIELPTYEEV
ncbi:type I restriction enzyme, S subunit [Trichococcus flocculiformis]|uniref:restriction endonuclease subunit S n=1 Tax=Trichococcus TaxID=82802 RepID=UPI0007A90BD9|nr:MULTISPECIES: restriction endonuclease subunit S [Trichococcus]CZR01218.1 restriction endonuclease type i hsds [Trichococcus sp. ES5]SHF65672.1 type I restriction enzyme, S subunit [Trichococcus flocculiformis]